MLDLAWSELALIAVVAVVVIGPKDLPEAVRGVAKGIQKLRRMAGEFQGHVDEVVREAKLEDVRNQINEIRNFDLKGEIERHVDKDGDLRRTFQDDPLRNAFTDSTITPPPPAPAADAPVPPVQVADAPSEAPAFIPPGAAAPVSQDVPAPQPPAFVPPSPPSADGQQPVTRS